MKRVILASAVVVALTATIYAHPYGGCKEDRGYYMQHKMHKGFNHRNSVMRIFKHIRKELNLTKEQRIKIREVMQEKREKLRALRATVGKRYRMDISSFMSGTKFDKSAFRAEMERVRASRMERNIKLRDKRLDIIADSFSKIFDILTPSQREKLIQLSKR